MLSFELNNISVICCSFRERDVLLFQARKKNKQMERSDNSIEEDAEIGYSKNYTRRIFNYKRLVLEIHFSYSFLVRYCGGWAGVYVEGWW